ncbi:MULTISPECIES: hypothetical protein [unclassified Streptomyces]|uniref:hypothetical protein n=1 Tax=unclassified Streptomyces TaxID=2593676 RepID=UPI002252D5FD|nr:MULTISPECIES: hypothetical protein [unclassified Streptomyces]MCX5047804.1 hypothetical protein [Streptomyces sp. NBC_00474]MCX5245633.1 hypothetical protein [Streptomyces sp. NBC_00201]
MSADRETNHDMTNTDIALLLAEAADGVEIGIAPTQAVIRGGRRRRARRWAVATAAALAIVGTTGTLALAGLPGDGDGHRGAQVATHPPTTAAPRLGEPQSTTLARGTEDGKDWDVWINVWGAPRNAAEAQTQLAAMTEYGEFPGDIRQASDLIGKSAYFVHRSYGDQRSLVIYSTLPKGSREADTDLESGSTRLQPASGGPVRLVIGRVAKSAQEVTCSWQDGTRTKLRRLSGEAAAALQEQGIRPAEGSPDNWFVCLAPKGTGSKSVFVTKLG